MSEGTVTIPSVVYNDLLEARNMLNRLYAAGVDNWEGYAEALADDEDETYEEIYGTTES